MIFFDRATAAAIVYNVFNLRQYLIKLPASLPLFR